MRLEALQGAWVVGPVGHSVRVALAVEEPASIWSGASDGKIIRWSLDSWSFTSKPKDVLPLALLGGHTSAIVGLQLCTSEHTKAVLSVCFQGGVCIWDTITTRCYKRRKLPPSVSHPTAVRSLTSKYACISYVCATSDSEQVCKGGVVILDTVTLTVIQNVYHGQLPTSEINEILVLPTEEMEYTVLGADLYGRVHAWSKIKLEEHGKTKGQGENILTEYSQKFQAVSFSSDGKFLLLVSNWRWVIKNIHDQTILEDSLSGDTCNIGGYFFKDGTKLRFIIWNMLGAAVVYSLKTSEGSVSVSATNYIPATQRSSKGNVYFCFIGGTYIRFECEISLTLWSLNPHKPDILEMNFVGKGNQTENLQEYSVTCSLIIPDIQPTIVCGYANGDIQVTEFQYEAPFKPPLRLSHHNSSVLCLAVHPKAKQVLLSGCMDGVVCIWDLINGGKLMAVLHHHVAPVRHFYLPPSDTHAPWDECFISVGEDGAVVLSSLTTLRAERFFPGHTGTIREVLWDEVRAYLAVSCSGEILYIWDIHSGARERILRGPAVHSMLKHFMSRKKMASYTPLTSASSLVLPNEEDVKLERMASKHQAVRVECPCPGIAAVYLDISTLLSEKSVEERRLKMCLSLLHLWGVDTKLDYSIINELGIYEPRYHRVAAGFAGNRGAVSFNFPTKEATLELWKSSSDFCSMRALIMVSLAQRLITLSAPGSFTCSALAAFYSSGVYEKLGGTSPSLEVYVSFWQDHVECIRLAARMLFHTAAPNAIPNILRDGHHDLINWLEYTDGSYQDAKASRIIISGALSVYHKSLVRDDVAETVGAYLIKLVRTGDKHSSTAAEILSEGMRSTWQGIVRVEIPQLISDVLSLVQFNGADNSSSTEAFNGLLSSLAAVDMQVYVDILGRCEYSCFKPGLMAFIKAIRISPLLGIHLIGQVIGLIIQALNKEITSKNGNISSLMQAIEEIVKVYSMVALYSGSSPKLAVGDPIGDIRSLAIHVYDLHSGTIMRVLDASGPPGYPALRSGKNTQGITALSFSTDGEGLVGFSHRGLIIRWWSLGAAWWEKLTRSTVPVQCTKLVLVPPSPGFSPKSSSTSFMAALSSTDTQAEQEDEVEMEEIDLSFRLEWKTERTVALIRGSEELGLFQL